MSAKRKHISLKVKLAATLLDRGDIPYSDAKQMTADQIISLFHWDHNMLHAFEDEDRDKFWNLRPMYISAHRTKTKQDRKAIAKVNRLRANPVVLMADAVSAGLKEGMASAFERLDKPLPSRLRSRGFDKRFTKKMDGTVIPRKDKRR